VELGKLGVVPTDDSNVIDLRKHGALRIRPRPGHRSVARKQAYSIHKDECSALVPCAGSAVACASATPPRPNRSSVSMAKETAQLADYAATFRYEDVPPDVIERAKQCIADTIAAVIFGYDLPWSRMVVAFAERNGAGGNSRILGPGGGLLHAPGAALANGALAHAFEMDNLTWPNSGVHPGATLLASALALAQERGSGGAEAPTAVHPPPPTHT